MSVGHQWENTMKRCKLLQGLLIALVIGVVAGWGCAGSKSSDAAAMQPGSYTETMAESPAPEIPTKSSDEDDVLRLLGINKSKEQPAPAAAVAAKTAEEQQLDVALKDKDAELAALRAEVSERDRQIARLQEQLSKKETQPARVSYASGSFKERYDAARELYESRKYQQAIPIFESLIQSGGDKSLLDNCQYWIGECYYGNNQYSQAIVEFEKVFTYSDSDKYDDSQLKLGLCYLRIGNVEKAKDEFEKLIVNYPDSEYRQRAKEYLARL
ncbi:tetratricopeptide repeat protein [bacterium]|nr:tetratricopeptide repeat protein [bacterium]